MLIRINKGLIVFCNNETGAAHAGRTGGIGFVGKLLVMDHGKRMANVFISYSRKDISFTKRLTTELQKWQHEFWIDWERIPPTVDWWKEIEKGIEEADAFLFLISPDSAKSKVCRREIDHAVHNGKRIIPIVVKEIDREQAPKQVEHLNYIFFSREDDFDTAAKKLITAIQTDYEWAATHRRLQIRALEWEAKNRDHSSLLRGKDLQEAELELNANTSKDPNPTDLQRQYVFASRQDATRRQRQTTAGIAVALVVSILLGVAAVFQRQEAVKQARISRAGDLAGQATILRDTDLALSLLLGVEAYNSQDNYRTRVALLENTNMQPRMMRILAGHSSWVKDVAFSPDGSVLVSAGCANYDSVGDDCSRGEVIFWDMEPAQKVSYTYGWLHLNYGVKMRASARGATSPARNGKDSVLPKHIVKRVSNGQRANDVFGQSKRELCDFQNTRSLCVSIFLFEP